MTIDDLKTKDLLRVTGESKELTDREKHLIGLAVTATRGCIACTGGRLKAAIQAGIPKETVYAGIDLAAAINAGVTAAIALQGAERVMLDEVIRETVDDPCPKGACTVGVPESA